MNSPWDIALEMRLRPAKSWHEGQGGARRGTATELVFSQLRVANTALARAHFRAPAPRSYPRLSDTRVRVVQIQLKAAITLVQSTVLSLSLGGKRVHPSDFCGDISSCSHE